MNTNQKHTPKYWVAHDPTIDDVYVDTADKSYDGCYERISELMMGQEYLEGAMQENRIKISLVEINLIKT